MQNEVWTSATLITAILLMCVGAVSIPGDFALVYWITLIGFIACILIVQTYHAQGKDDGFWLTSLPATNGHSRDLFLIVDIFTLISMFEWTVWLTGQFYLFLALVVQLYIMAFSTLKIIDAIFPEEPPLRNRTERKSQTQIDEDAKKAELELEASNYVNMWRGGMPPGG